MYIYIYTFTCTYAFLVFPAGVGHVVFGLSESFVGMNLVVTRQRRVEGIPVAAHLLKGSPVKQESTRCQLLGFLEFTSGSLRKGNSATSGHLNRVLQIHNSKHRSSDREFNALCWDARSPLEEIRVRLLV